MLPVPVGGSGKGAGFKVTRFGSKGARNREDAEVRRLSHPLSSMNPYRVPGGQSDDEEDPSDSDDMMLN